VRDLCEPELGATYRGGDRKYQDAPGRRE
jgi:hypothetical protein